MKKLFQHSSQDIPARRRDDGGAHEAPTPPVAPMTYRRNRTITGSSSASVASSNELHADLLSPRAKVHHLSRRRRRLFSHFFIVALLSLGIYLLLSQSIASVAVSTGNATTTPTQKALYEARFQKYFEQHPLERLLFNVDTNALLQFIASEYPEVSHVTLDTSGIFGRAHGFVSLRQPIARWTLGGQSEFVDQQGVVFRYNGYQTPALQIIDSSGASTASGLVTSDRFLAFVGRVVGAAKLQGYTVTQAVIPPLTTRQLEVKVDSVPYPIKLTIEREAGEQAEDMARTIKYLQAKGVSPTYIDVRVEGRAVYK